MLEPRDLVNRLEQAPEVPASGESVLTDTG
jgi:hypothetical protein